MQTSISAPLEHYLGRIPALALMSSSSSYGTSQITLQFKLSKSLASASLDVQAAINASTGWLPVNDLPSPPIYHQVNPADMPVLVIALTSDTMPLHAITEFAATAIIPQLGRSGRRRRSQPAGRPSAGGAAAGQSTPAHRPWTVDGRCSRGHRKQRRSINRRGRSTARGRPLRSAPTISCSPPRTIATRSSPIATSQAQSSTPLEHQATQLYARQPRSGHRRRPGQIQRYRRGPRWP